MVLQRGRKQVVRTEKICAKQKGSQMAACKMIWKTVLHLLQICAVHAADLELYLPGTECLEDPE